MRRFILHPSSFIFLALLAGCATAPRGAERTLHYNPPPVRYETFDPVFPNSSRTP